MRRIAIVGAGASGMACAEALKDDPQNAVTIIERTKCCGGMATSEEIDPKRFGASFINDGVQVCMRSTAKGDSLIESHRARVRSSTIPMQSLIFSASNQQR